MVKMIKADLHTHSYYSDGAISPTELVKQVKKAGIGILALTDHTSVKGVDEAIRAGKKFGVRIIPAAEITGKEGEILVYFIDVYDKELDRLLRRCSAAIQGIVKNVLLTLRRRGENFSFKELEKTFPMAKNNHNRGHLLRYLKFKGFEQSKLGKFEKFKMKMHSQEEVSILEIVKEAKRIGGVPVLSHPWFSKEILFNPGAMKKLVKAGLVGLEFDNGDRTLWGRDKRTVKMMKYYAKKYGLILTKGTDYHAIPWMKGKGHLLGRTFCDERVVDKLERIKRSAG